MSVSAIDLKLYQATTMPASTSTSNVGGAISATEITGGSIGEIFPTLAANTSGGGTKTCYASVFYKNTNATDSLTSSKIYMRNALDQPGVNGTVAVASTSASDDTTKKIRVLGRDASSVALQEEITMNGTSTSTGAQTFSAVHRVECRLVSGGSLTTTAGDTTITRGSALGMIPTGLKSATGEVAFGLEATMNTSATTTNATTAPSGISFDNPATYAAGTATAGSGTMAAADKQQIWLRLQIAELAKPSADVQIDLTLQGETA